MDTLISDHQMMAIVFCKQKYNTVDLKCELEVCHLLFTQLPSSLACVSQDFFFDNTSWIYKELKELNALRILIFSGDVDDVCATEGTQEWVFRIAGEPKVYFHSVWCLIICHVPFHMDNII